MTTRSCRRSALRWSAAGAGTLAAAYAAYAGVTWIGYGRPRSPSPDEHDALLDRFMPAPEVVERHHVRVAAPAAVTLAVAQELDLFDVPVVRAVFKGRELIMGAAPDTRSRPRGLLADMQSIGWLVLAQIPERELVVGAVTKPWEANVTFRPVPADAFASFDEPDYVKIAWTLRADPAGESASIFRTETRVLATDASARSKFRTYWAFLSPGILLIRWTMLGPVKAEAERRTATRAAPPSAGSTSSGTTA
jgi:hypothetical protein